MSYGSGFNPAPPTSIGTGHSYPYNPPGRQLRGRSSASAYPAQRLSGGSGILPTPDPTNASAISDEDVALQLMRLGDPMAFSHGRTSTSTLDDALSGKAELASSDEEDSDEEDEEAANNLPSRPGHVQDVGPQRKKQRVMNELPSDGTSGSDDYEDRRDRNFLGSDGMNGTYEGLKKKLKGGRASLPGSSKAGKPRSLSMMKPKTKPSTFPKVPMSPSSMPAPSRKGSIASTLNFQHQLGTDEEDLSAKPRCQRCRKSKKGCDRQRPCGRCKDAGIGIEGCVSEDEGNGRKGRYGRHMGVPIKKGEEGYEEMDDSPVPPAGIPANGYFLAPALPDKSKKRKR